MTFLEMSARGHHGYPQPEDDYEELVYADYCLRCGIHGRQIAPFRLKRSQRAPHSHFLQLNWVFDVFFVHPEVKANIEAAKVTGVSFGPALDHGSGHDLSDRVQLVISATVSCAETSRLPTVTCRPKNEETETENLGGGEKRYTQATPHCGRVKFHPPTSPAIDLGAVHGVPDVFQTAEWFGSGGSAHRLTLVSERFAALVLQRGWRGLQFSKVRESGWSERNLG